VCSPAVAPGKEPDQLTAEERATRQRYATRSVELLAKAEAAGFFKTPGAVEHMQRNKELDAVRNHPGYRDLLARLRGNATKPPPPPK
jgi:hypothetical protein